MNATTKQLRDLLKRRNYTFERVCYEACVDRSQFSQVLNRKRVNHVVKLKVSNVLEHRELELLGWPAVEPEYQI